MKKLLHIIAQRPEKTGSGIYLQAMLREADKKDYKQAFIAALNEGENFIFTSKNKIDFYPVFFNSKELPFNMPGMSDVMPYESTKYSEVTLSMLTAWKAEFKKVITRAVSEFNPDMIICHHLWILTALVKEIYPNIKTSAICHGTDLRQLELSPDLKEYAVKGCSKLEYIFSLNDYQKEKIVQKYGVAAARVHVIGSGYNSHIFNRENHRKDKDTIELVYAGKLNLAKGVLSMIKAVDKLSGYDKKIKLIIAGGGNSACETEEIYRTARECRYEVNFTGAISQEQLGKIFGEADIFILPSFYEGLPLVLIEALASGLRVVATDLPGVRDWIGENINSSGIIQYVKLPEMDKIDVPKAQELPVFEERLKAALEFQIRMLLENNHIREDLVYKSINKLSWGSVFETIENILNKSIEQSKKS
ncbi:MAG: glycosyltransferase family 4 protein [Solirubrobacterales bacterium]